MKRTRLLVLSIAVVALLVTPMLALAQDEEEWTEFSTDMGLTVYYPAEMVVGVDEEVAYPHILVASSEGLLETMLFDIAVDIPLKSGQSAVILILLPEDILMVMAPEVDWTSEDMDWDAFMVVLAEEMGDEDTEVGEAESVEVEVDGETHEVGVIGFTSEEDEGVFIAYGEEGIWAVGMAATFIGEFEDFRETALEIFVSTSFEGTAEDLWDVIMESLSNTGEVESGD